MGKEGDDCVSNGKQFQRTVTLNEPLFCVSSPNSIALKADYITVVEDRPMGLMCAEYPLPLLAKTDSRNNRTVFTR